MSWSETKASIATIATTLGVNLAWLIDLIPDNIGKLSTLLGVIAIIYVIRHHNQKIEINKLDIAERIIRINNLRNEKDD